MLVCNKCGEQAYIIPPYYLKLCRECGIVEENAHEEPADDCGCYEPCCKHMD